MNFRLLVIGGLALAVFAARAELAATNFSAGNPIKIMAVGDSITDDCSIQYAWRRPLQLLLDSNSIPFKFVGRQYSTVLSGPLGTPFSKTNHEGYCGTVIAPPGVYGPVHGYALANSYLQKIVPDALTNATPDIFLILIGANDIGRGRDPYRVAGVDMPGLLDTIFSKAPRAQVILAKPSTMRNSTVAGNGTNYSVFATNVAVYNAQLQAMVNGRRALGQNVFLSDMFSVVDYATGIGADHLHPNATGLAAIALEWMTRIQTILTATNRITASLIHAGDVWAYADTGADLGTNWSQPGFDDSGWNAGYGRFGYGDATDASIVKTNVTTYFRKTFVAPWNAVFTNLNFRLAQTGGAVVWLNGREIYRTNLPGGPVTFATPATTNLTGDPANIYYPTNIPGTNLVAGTNVVAVEAHQTAGTNAAMGFDLELLGGALVVGPPGLSAGRAQENIVLTWAAGSGAAFALYTAANLEGAAWAPVSGARQTNAGQISMTVAPGSGRAFFRLQLSQ